MTLKNTNIPIYGEVSTELLAQLTRSWLASSPFVSIKPIPKMNVQEGNK
jgi:hypothetical protein